MGEQPVQTTDAQLLDAWRRGVTAAGQELFERHYEAIERFLHNKIGPDQAVDLAQEVFVACVENRERIPDSARFRTYLLGIAYRRLCQHLRERYRRGPSVDITELALHNLEPSPSARYARATEQRLLLEGLRCIPLKYQVVLELYYWEDLGTAEIATVLDVAPGTIRSRLQRARDALEAAMASIARSPEQLESTVTRLEQWAASCRELSEWRRRAS